MAIKELLLNNIKNISGKKSHRKLVVFAVDDYGNVRLHSREARKQMEKEGLKFTSRFDNYDALETREDLEHLFETLSAVKDAKGNPAVFTPFAVPCNIDFEQMRAEGYHEYRYETLPDTFAKLAQSEQAAYEGTWDLWREGTGRGLLQPQFHGREHLNVREFNHRLSIDDPELLVALKNRSLAGISKPHANGRSLYASFSFAGKKEVNDFHDILSDGINRFGKVFGYRPTVFMPPGGQDHPEMYPTLSEQGIQCIDTVFHRKKRIDGDKFKTRLGFMGASMPCGMKGILRNVVFEPSDERQTNHVNRAVHQIGAAFRWNKPAVISSHRVNFCGHIDPAYRKTGLDALKQLLKDIIKKWPDAEFVSSAELVNIFFFRKIDNV